MKSLRTFPVLLLAISLVLAQGGCGGDDDSTAPPPAGECSIAITNPLGGSSYLHGEEIKIRWDKQGSAAMVNIKLLKGDNILGDIGVVPNVEYKSWTASTMGAASGADYAIRVTAVGEDACGDDSGRFEIINTEGCSLDFTINYDPDDDPDTPFVLESGQEFEITWDTQNTAGRVDIELLRGDRPSDEPVGYIASNLLDTGSYLWTVDTLHQGTYDFFYLRLSARGVEGCTAETPEFRIVDEEICEIWVNQPQTGALWTIGSTQNISFTTVDPATTHVLIRVYQGTVAGPIIETYLPVDATNEPQEVPWVVDLTGYEPQGNSYRIRVFDANDQYCVGVSGLFTINEN